MNKEKCRFFECNLHALSAIDSKLCTRLSSAKTTLEHYKFLEARDGSLIPAYVDKSGTARPMHSLIAPEKEAQRIMTALGNESYIIILGFGAAYTLSAALQNEKIKFVLVIDYDIDGFSEILCSKDFSDIFSKAKNTPEKKLSILIDPSESEIEKFILYTYNPCLHNGMRTIPLRSKCDFDTDHFIPAACAIKSALNKVASDYSVQSFFGKRWFSNIIRNLSVAEKQNGVLPPVKKAAICAAGPSLDIQLETIKDKRSTFFLIAADTSLGTLLNAAIVPDAIISIDCQHISYYHFVGYDIKDIPLFLDIASPPLLSKLSNKTYFFLSAHPFCDYIEKHFRSIPRIDSSGGNVTYAALSLALTLGAKEIEVYGADFSYPCGNIYTRGAYFYPYFHRRSSRLAPTESQTAAFLFKSSSLKLRSVDNTENWYYETKMLEMYRSSFSEKASCVSAKVTPAQGLGAKILIDTLQINQFADVHQLKLFAYGNLIKNAEEFLKDFKDKIENLDNDMMQEDWIPLLPAAAALKHKNKIGNLKELAEQTKIFCIENIEKILFAQ
ncbi:MAG: hypothetical protein Ta2F_04670 [Termitinemataceae bacterium]|nr:MAG: hypothetical protein Ta2F_04670 [Termitinemataceae bacterium]